MKQLIAIIALSTCAALTFGQIPIITVQPESQSVPIGGNATLSVTATGTGPFTYQWQLNGTNVFGGNPGLITTVAGNGIRGFSGDGGPATNASLGAPQDVALDKVGNLYIADQANNRIREVSVNGIITTVAGGGSGGLGDGGPATNATLNQPLGVAVDAAGNLYISDSGNSRVRRVDTNGIIITFAGGGSGGLGDGGPATHAGLNQPTGVAFDTVGDVFFVDAGGNRVRKVDTNGIITTFAGNGGQGFSGDGGQATNASLNQPYFLNFDAMGNLYVADQNNQRVRRVDTNGIITTYAGNGGAGFSGDGGLATSASLYYPLGVAVDANGNLYIGDHGNSRIRRVDPNGIITTFAGNGSTTYAGDGGPATNASLYYPSGIALDGSGNLFMADENNNRIREVGGSSQTLTITDVTAANAGNYTVIVSNPYGSVTSDVAVVTLLDVQPSITIQPQDAYVDAYGTATFSVTATGTPPLYYQWLFNGSNVLNAIASNLTLSNVDQTELGPYTVVVASPSGAVTSSVANLYMYPSIITPFAGTVTDWGQSNVFSVAALGSGTLMYQWYNNNVPIPNATNATLVFPAIQFTNAGLYTVVVSSPLGSVTNAPVQVVVNPAGVSLGLYPGLTITGTVGYSYNIQSNPNLANTNGWTTVATVTLYSPVEFWVDINNNTTSPTNQHRFYRVLPAP